MIILTCIGIHVYYVYAAEVSANQIIALSFRDGIHDTQSMNYMYSLPQSIKQRERDNIITQNSLSSL